MFSAAEYIFDRDVFKDSGRSFVIILARLEPKLPKLIGAERVSLLLGWDDERSTVEVDEMIFSKWEGGDFFIDFGEGIEVFADDWEDALLGLHEGVEWIIKGE